MNASTLWALSLGTGVVALVLLTAVLVLGIMVNRQGRLPGLPRFAATSLHRSLSLLSVAFVGIHIGTATADPFVTIGLAASVVPFISPYSHFWIGLGAVSVDLMLALIVTSLLRARISRRTWRAVHWLAYICWPVAFAHSVGTGGGLRHGWPGVLSLVCVAAVAAALTWRVRQAQRQPTPDELPALVLASAGPEAEADPEGGAGPEGGASRPQVEAGAR